MSKNELNRLDEETAFKIIVDGKEVICYILLTFDNPSTNKKYIVYTDGTKNDDGTMEVLASIYNIVDGEVVLEEINTEEEWNMVDDMIRQVGDNNE